MQVVELPAAGASRREEGGACGLQVGRPLGLPLVSLESVGSLGSLGPVAIGGITLGAAVGCEQGHCDAAPEPMDGLRLGIHRRAWRKVR